MRISEEQRRKNEEVVREFTRAVANSATDAELRGYIKRCEKNITRKMSTRVRNYAGSIPRNADRKARSCTAMLSNYSYALW